MHRARIHEGIRRMRFTDILGRNERSELSQMEAAELLGINERTFRRCKPRPPYARVYRHPNARNDGRLGPCPSYPEALAMDRVACYLPPSPSSAFVRAWCVRRLAMHSRRSTATRAGQAAA